MPKVCRICLGEEEVQDFISPCNCKGFSQYVHKKCIKQWAVVKSGSMDKAVCEICLVKICMPEHFIIADKKDLILYQNSKKNIIGNFIVFILSVIIVILFFEFLASSRKKAFFWILVTAFLCLTFVSLLLLILNTVRICCLLSSTKRNRSNINSVAIFAQTEVV